MSKLGKAMEIILHLSTSFGDQSAGYRLHKSLREKDINSRILTGALSINDPALRQPEGFFERRIARLKMVFDQLPPKLYPHRTGSPFSPAIIPDFVIGKIMYENPSLVNLHWINGGFVRIETLKKIRRPIVWTLHDSWAFTGGCHIPHECKRYRNNCGECPVLGSKHSNDLSRSVFLRKQKAWKDLDLFIVAPSNWLCGCVKKSALFSDKCTKLIPNGIDINQFKPFNKELAREMLDLPKNKKLILFGAFNCTRDPNKGYEFLRKALFFIKNNNKFDNVELVIFGENDVIINQDCGLKLHSLGLIRDSQILTQLYSAVDVFVAPSLSENLPNTIMESLSCGTPTVAFHIGGIPDLVEHKSNGYLAVPYDSEDLARGIEWVLSDEKKWISLSYNAREKIVHDFEISKISQKYIELYDEILS
jgi:glycosyltransferase involved in cell wall biosynthesis